MYYIDSFFSSKYIKYNFCKILIHIIIKKLIVYKIKDIVWCKMKTGHFESINCQALPFIDI